MELLTESTLSLDVRSGHSIEVDSPCQLGTDIYLYSCNSSTPHSWSGANDY